MSTPPPANRFDVTCVENQVIPYATFQSHNQKVVANRRGIFMTYLRRRNAEYTAQHWRLMHSTDGGRSFRVLFEHTDATNAPCLCTDADDNIYMYRPDWFDRTMCLYRFLASDDYAKPTFVNPYRLNSVSGKFSMDIDTAKGLLYIVQNSGNMLLVTNLQGEVQYARRIWQTGPIACMEYPHVCVAPDGVLHLAWKTETHTRPPEAKAMRFFATPYWSVHHMQSRDGGLTWENADGKSIDIPVVADTDGAAQLIFHREADPIVSSTLANFIAGGDHVHFACAMLPGQQAVDGRIVSGLATPGVVPESPYFRLSKDTGRIDIRHEPRFECDGAVINTWNGFFATDRDSPDAPLYYVGAEDNQLTCIVTRDRGQTWSLHARSDHHFDEVYSLGGCRQITADGRIIGSVTNRVSNPAGHSPEATDHNAAASFFSITTNDASR